MALVRAPVCISCWLYFLDVLPAGFSLAIVQIFWEAHWVRKSKVFFKRIVIAFNFPKHFCLVDWNKNGAQQLEISCRRNYLVLYLLLVLSRFVFRIYTAPCSPGGGLCELHRCGVKHCFQSIAKENYYLCRVWPFWLLACCGVWYPHIRFSWP